MHFGDRNLRVHNCVRSGRLPSHHCVVSPATHWTSVGLAVFDGHGNILAKHAVSINGTFSFVSNLIGTYVINPDCTGTESDASGAVVGTLVMVHGGDEVLGISLVPGSSVT